MRRMNFTRWWDQFKPVGTPEFDCGPRMGDAPKMFETFGKDLETVRTTAQQEPNRVWTLLDCGAQQIITPGMHHVNRIGYFITERPCTSADREVLV